MNPYTGSIDITILCFLGALKQIVVGLVVSSAYMPVLWFPAAAASAGVALDLSQLLREIDSFAVLPKLRVPTAQAREIFHT